jgi:hypothetical protein
LKHLYANLILIFCPFLFQKAVKQEMDLEHSCLEGEIEADGADEDYSLEHQVSILVKSFICSSSYLQLQSFTGLHDLLYTTLVG